MSTMDWYPFNAANFQIPGYDSVKSLVPDSISITIANIEAIQAAYEILRLFTLGKIDPLKEALKIIRAEANSLTELLTETGAFATFHAPVTPSAQLNPNQMMAALSESLVDKGDPNRPDFQFPQEHVGFLFLMEGPNYGAVMRDFSRFMEAFLRPFKSRVRYKTKEELQAEFGNNTARGRGKAPDWESTNIGKLFPIMFEVKNVMLYILGILQYAEDTITLINAFIAYLDEKKSALNHLAQLLNDVDEGIALLGSLPPAHVLFIEGVYTTHQLAEDLFGIGVPAEINHKYLASASFFMLIAGGIPPLTLEMLKSLFGVP